LKDNNNELVRNHGRYGPMTDPISPWRSYSK
jgi:hypothetical protein